MYVSIYFLLSNGVLSGDDVDAELLIESCILLSLRSLIVLTIIVPKYCTSSVKEVPVYLWHNKQEGKE